MATINPSPTKPVVYFPTANIVDRELVTTHDTRLPDYRPLEYGTPYPDQAKFPGLKLVFQEPLGDDDRMVRRVWAGDRVNQDYYNAASRKYSGGSFDHPIIVRRYVLPYKDYTPEPLGTQDPDLPDAVLVDEEVTTIENKAGYVSVARVFETLPGPSLTGVLVTDKGQLARITSQTVLAGTSVAPSALTVAASVKPVSVSKSELEKVEVTEVFDEKSFSVENPDPVPPKFRVAIPAFREEHTVEGVASQPTLQTAELSKSEQQLTVYTKKTSKTSRDPASLPVSLTQTDTNEQGLKATVVETLQVGDTSDTPSATVSVESEAMGDGTYVIKKTTLPEVFDGKAFSVENPDPVPPKFRVAIPAFTERENVAGTVAQPVLGTAELSKSEEQVTKHVKRTSKTSRDTASLPVSLTQTDTNEQGLKATVVETLQVGDTSDTPSATVSVESEAMGDGTYVIKKTTLPEVFDGKAFSVENPDPVPPKFRVAIPAFTERENVAGTVAQPVLGTAELSKSEEQVTKHVKRTSKTSRDTASLPVSLTQTATNEQGLKATVEETLQVGDTSDSPSAKVSVESEAMGDGTYVIKKTTLPEVFDGKSYSVENPDPVPPKFRIAIPAFTERENVEGTATQPTLGTAELSKSEEQVTKHVKRTSKTSRDPASLPVSLTQTATNEQGLKATVEETLQVGDTSDSPSAKVSVESEAMGDGTYVIKKTTLPQVFDAKSLGAVKPNVVPERFRAAIPDESESYIEEAASVTTPSLSSDEISKTESRLTEFVRRVEITKNQPAGSYPPLTWKQYDDLLDIQIGSTETLDSAPSSDKGVDVTPLSDDKYLNKELDLQAAKAALMALSWSIPTEVSISLPDVLEDFNVHWEESEGEGGSQGDPVVIMNWTPFSGVSITTKRVDSAYAQVSKRPVFSYNLKKGYSGPAIATEHTYYTDSPNVNTSTYGQNWPIFQTTGGTVVFTGGSESKRVTKKMVFNSYISPGPGSTPTNTTSVTTLEDSSTQDTSYHVAQIPPSLHAQIQASAPSTKSKSVTRGVAAASASVTGSVTGTIPATSYTSIPSGTFVVSSSLTPYKYGMYRVKVLTVDLTPYV